MEVVKEHDQFLKAEELNLLDTSSEEEKEEVVEPIVRSTDNEVEKLKEKLKRMEE